MTFDSPDSPWICGYFLYLTIADVENLLDDRDDD
jgi:hypothetical protein